MRPLTRGYSHKIAFCIAFGACLILIDESHGHRALTANIIYSLSLIGLFGISALYHCTDWSRPNYLLMKRIDHAAIFALIAGTATPICLLGLKRPLGTHILSIMWTVAALGMIVTIFWTHSPKWLRACCYVALGWLALPYLSRIQDSIGTQDMWFLLTGGLFYTVGAVVYASKRPDPFPQFFGYHEIFHLFVVIASAFHFAVIYSIST